MVRRLTLLLCAAYSLHAADAAALVRISQVGYTPQSGKHARLMSKVAESGATFRVITSGGAARSNETAVFSAAIGKPLGGWNSAWPFVYDLDFSALRTPGEYTIRIEGPAPAESPAFPLTSGADIYTPLLRNSLGFFQTQRDGPDVPPGPLHRKPAHLADKEAFVYRTPSFHGNALAGELQRVGGPVDVSGGWSDAGDYLKFVQTTSYVTAMMLQGIRDYPAQLGRGGLADFTSEARFGLDWLLKMWNADSATLYLQVGIGEGNARLIGDHDIWRLPEADDHIDETRDAPAGSPRFFIRHRPVFAAESIRGKISPNLAGRLAASFALGYQVFRDEDPAWAARLLAAARQIFDLAATANVTRLTTTYPHSFYPEEQWRDDLEWGAVELHLALAAGAHDAGVHDVGAHDAGVHDVGVHDAGVHDADAARYLRLAAHWAREYAASRNQDSLNLYDVSGIAHFELCRAMERAPSGTALEISRDALIAQLKARLDIAAARSRKDPFALGFPYNGGDLTPHAIGLALEAGFYDQLTGTATFADFSSQQTAFVLGANAWGTSFIVGAGAVFPLHLHHQLANLSGQLDGTAPLLPGAVVDGPAANRAPVDELPDGAHQSRWPGGLDPFAAFNRPGAYYADESGNWASVEPALDYTIPSVLLFARRIAAAGP